MTTQNNVWEIVDNDFADVACEKCAHAFLVERGIQHELGKNYADEKSGVYAQEDVFRQHAEYKHVCACGKKLF
jgi:hypothetical protein